MTQTRTTRRVRTQHIVAVGAALALAVLLVSASAAQPDNATDDARARDAEYAAAATQYTRACLRIVGAPGFTAEHDRLTEPLALPTVTEDKRIGALIGWLGRGLDRPVAQEVLASAWARSRWGDRVGLDREAPTAQGEIASPRQSWHRGAERKEEPRWDSFDDGMRTDG